jgi:type IV/VI secretion system ImpK/VasF family protein
MVTTNNEKSAVHHMHLHVKTVHPETDPPFQLNKNASQPLVLHSKFIIHHHKAGVNPLVDAAAYLFSSIGKIKRLKSYHNLGKLQKELMHEMSTFEASAKAYGYSSEYIVVSRYALSATVDDIITNTSWGKDGQWDPYSLLDRYNQESGREDRFFLILERITKDPKIYIDVMELMYICLSLGYKGAYRHSADNHQQLETITHTLYQHIRAFHGDYSKTLSPFSARQKQHLNTHTPKVSYWFTFFITASIILLLFISLGFLLENISKEAYEELMHIGKSLLYESNHF